MFKPINIIPLVFFRVAFGGLMLWEVWRYFHYTRITRYYVEPSFFFHYYGFDWLYPLPGDGMYLLFHFVGVLSVAIMLGVFYRISMTLFWLCFSYIFLLDQAQYLNHFYLISLISFLMIFIPAHRAYSVDALLRPAIRSSTAPAWALWVLRGQMGLVYFFGGLAKINPDWLRGEPMRGWMADRTDFPLIGHLFTEEWLVYLFSYGGLLLDLLIVPLLLWRYTRIPALLLAAVFHITNSQLFNIGIFPWFALAATLLFLPPAWFPRTSDNAGVVPTNQPYAVNRWIQAGIVVYFAIQVWLPLRNWLYPGDPSWTEEGHNLAWHMRLRDKAGDTVFYVGDPTTGASWQIDAEDYLSERQADQMSGNPDMILRFAHYLGELYPDMQIHVYAMISLNHRAPQLLIDPTVDLTQQPYDLLPSDWILPLMQKPSPHPTIPTLLISRRYPDVLLLVNITETPFPLDHLTIQWGNHQVTDFGVTELAAGECLLAHTETANLMTVFAPCNEAGTRVIIPPELTGDGLLVNGSLCYRKSCVITPR